MKNSWLRERFIICSALLLIFSGSYSSAADPAGSPTQQKVHKNVQAALDWQLPESECKQPPVDRSQQKTTQGDDGSDLAVSDTDYYTLGRQERKMKRWQKCIDRYKSGLRKDFSKLKDCAQYGLTKPQADLILGKMKTIQLALVAHDGIPAEPETPSASTKN